MTKGKFIVRNGRYEAFEFSGHVGIDTKGKDVVCAAISAIVQATIIGINEVLKEEIAYTIKDGKVKCTVNSKNECVQAMIKTLYKTTKQLAAQYPKNLSVVEVER